MFVLAWIIQEIRTRKEPKAPTKTLDDVFDLVRKERTKQIAKYGNGEEFGDETWLRIAIEEIGEVAREMDHRGMTPAAEKRMESEIVQFVTVGCAWLCNRQKGRNATAGTENDRSDFLGDSNVIP